MLGRFIIGFHEDAVAIAFAVLIGLGLLAGYALLGATWLIMKTHGDLPRAALRIGSARSVPTEDAPSPWSSSTLRS